jgi:hypothetical protein
MNIQHSTSNNQHSKIAHRGCNRCWILLILICLATSAVGAEIYFREGVDSYHAGNFAEASRSFQNSLAAEPASGTLLNLGLTEWRRGRAGNAIAAWEESAWMNPFDNAARKNLEYARDTLQVNAPEFTWYERASLWLPTNWWAWAAGGSLWLAVALMTLPGFFRVRKTGWHQAVAALGFGVFLFSIPPSIGVVTRMNIGIVTEKNAPLRLTPTREGESNFSLSSGEPVRKLRERGDFILVRSQSGLGWIAREQVAFLGK